MSKMKFTSEISVELIDSMGNDDYIVAAARVSTRGATVEPETTIDEAAGLINYLMKHRHGTPFEHGSACFRVHAPIFVWREWHRHRIGFSYNEESGRYKVLEPVFYVPPRDRPMFKVDNWKPGRPKFQSIGDVQFGDVLYVQLCANLRDSYEFAYQRYEENLAMGFDPGLARDCLPVGIYSSCWVTCNPRSLMAFLSLRTYEPTAQAVSYPLYEIEVAARKVEEIFARLWPLTHRAFTENGRVGP
jgi:thymidylate synthase (FAD)